MNIVQDIVGAVMNNDTDSVQSLIDCNQIQAHDCLALRTAVYCNNSQITQMVVEHSDVFSFGANAVYLSIENNFQDIFDILLPHVCAKNDSKCNFEFLIQSVAGNQSHMVEKLAPIADLPNQSLVGVMTRINIQTNPKIVQCLMENMSQNQRIGFAENFALAGDAQRLRPVVEHLSLVEVEQLCNMIRSLSDQNLTLSENGRSCFDILDQHRQKCVLEVTVGSEHIFSKRKL